MFVMDGMMVRGELMDKYKDIVNSFKTKIKLAIIVIGDNAASELYVKNKIKYCSICNIEVSLYNISEDVLEDEVILLINKLNNDSSVTGIILQSPVPGHIDFDKCASLIKPSKDIDGFTEKSINDLYYNKEGLVPCTVKGIIYLLDYYKIDVSGKSVVIVGRGNIVGKPLMLALLNRDATVTITHSKTINLEEYTKRADIVISAVGRKNIINSSMIRDGSVVIDVGINVVDGKLYGDVDYEEVSKKCSYITPVPGGVGPMTVAMIIDNLIYAKRSEEG